jgi:hypothetical protein
MGPELDVEVEIMKKVLASVKLQPRLFFALTYKVWKPVAKLPMGIAAVLVAESAAGEMLSFVPRPTPGSVSKKYSISETGPAEALLAEAMKKVLDSVSDQRLAIRDLTYRV